MPTDKSKHNENLEVAATIETTIEEMVIKKPTVKTNISEEITITEEVIGEEVTPENFVINNLAVTLLNLENSDPLLAEKCIKITPKDHAVFFEFFKKHIEETRNGNNTRECKFTDKDSSILTKISRYNSQKSEESFITFVNEVSKNLFTIMKDATKSSGSFFILDATFHQEEIIILIKLDPKNGVQLDLETLDLKEIKNMLPESNDRVHKCAIIKTNYVEGATNLFVLDRQQKAGETSKFFMTTFLQATPIPDNKIKTLAVLKELYEKIEANVPKQNRHLIEPAIEAEFNNGTTVHLPTTITNIYNKVISEDEKDRDIVIERFKNDFLDNYNNKFKDYGTSFVVDRESNTVTYKAKSNKIFFKYNKSLEGSEVKIRHDLSSNTYTITITNSDEIQFNKIIK